MRPERIEPTTAVTANRPFNAVALHNDTSRLDAIAKVTGRARYASDQTQDRPLVAAFVRCPWGRAQLESANIDSAKGVPGIIDVRVEVGAEGRYHGHPVGHLVAENIHALRRGISALECQWRRDDAVHDLDTAMPDDPALSAEERATATEALEQAAHRIDSVYSTQVQTHSTLETHGARVDYLGDRAVIHGSTQANFGFRDGLNRVLGLPEGAVEMHCEYVGGGFGSKLGAGKEGLLAAEVSKRFNRPCIVFNDRKADHVDAGNRPSSRQHMTLGVAADGRITGGSSLTVGGVGVAGGGGGVRGQGYRLGRTATKHADAQFNAGAPRPFRAPGCPQGQFALELAMDELADAAGMDPVEFRRANGMSDNASRMADLGMRAIGWDRRQPNGAGTGPIKTGYGMGYTDWFNGKTRCDAEVVIHPDGSIEARSGTQDIGTGQRTVVGVVAATYLGVPLRMVQAKVGCTLYPYGPASGGSVTTRNSAPAVAAAAARARTQILQRVGEKLGATAEELSIAEGRVMRGGEEVMDWARACRLLTGELSARASWPDEGDEFWKEGHSEGVQFARVSVDTATGVVRVDRIVAIQSCGQAVCRKTAESQILGAVTQGLSYALLENRILDRDTAAMVNPNFEMYKITGPVDMPEIVPILWHDGQTGARSLGEPPTIPTSGAVACAVYNAVGAPVRSLPMTPDKVLGALRSKGGAS